jgi:hypothetical protein
MSTPLFFIFTIRSIFILRDAGFIWVVNIFLATGWAGCPSNDRRESRDAGFWWSSSCQVLLYRSLNSSFDTSNRHLTVPNAHAHHKLGQITQCSVNFIYGSTSTPFLLERPFEISINSKMVSNCSLRSSKHSFIWFFTVFSCSSSGIGIVPGWSTSLG